MHLLHAGAQHSALGGGAARRRQRHSAAGGQHAAGVGAAKQTWWKNGRGIGALGCLLCEWT